MSENERLADEICELCKNKCWAFGAKTKAGRYNRSICQFVVMGNYLYPLAFAAGEKAQKEKDQQEIKKIDEQQEKDIQKLLATHRKIITEQTNRYEQALSEAEKRGARKLMMEWVRTFAFTDPQFVPASGKEAVRICIPESEWQSKLKSLEG